MEEKLGHVLIVEDEYLIAADLAEALEELGMTIVGPFSNIAHATAAIEGASQLHGAVIDINLAGELSYPIAELLRERHIPFVFTSGYDRIDIPSSFCQVPLLTKPADPAEIASTLAALISDWRPALP